jgi:hypothetical protein
MDLLHDGQTALTTLNLRWPGTITSQFPGQYKSKLPAARGKASVGREICAGTGLISLNREIHESGH